MAKIPGVYRVENEAANASIRSGFIECPHADVTAIIAGSSGGGDGEETATAEPEVPASSTVPVPAPVTPYVPSCS